MNSRILVVMYCALCVLVIGAGKQLLLTVILRYTSTYDPIFKPHKMTTTIYRVPMTAARVVHVACMVCARATKVGPALIVLQVRLHC